MMLSLPLPVLAMTVLSLILFGILLLHNYRKLEQKSIESKNNNKLRQTFIDADNRMIYLKDEKLKYIFFNRALENFFNRSASEIKGNNDYALIDQEFASLLRKTDQAVLEKKERIVETLNWRNRIYQATKFPVKLNNGRYGVGAYIEDITAISYSKRQEEKSLLRSSILVDVFTRNFKSSREQLDYVLDKALALTESKYGYIYLYDEAKQDFILNSWSPGAAAEKARDELEKTSLWGELVRRGKPILVNNHHAPNSFQRESAEGDAALKRLMSIPVMVEDKIVAAVVLADKEEDYDDNDLHQVTVLMTGVWHAIERRERAIELREANLTLQENQEKLQLILDSTAEGIYGIDREGRCTFCNASCLRMLGYSSQEELIGKNMHWQIHHSRPDGSPISLDECRIFRAFRIGKGIHADDEVLWRADGSCFAAEYYSYPQFKDGKVIGAVVTFMDITERKKVEEEIRYISYHDSLTGLYNRAFFIEELKRLDTERNLPLSIIMGDMNGLKLTNDIFGHAAGDMLLQKGAAILKKVCRADDIIARIGGDEFVILLPKTDFEDCQSIMERIKGEFSKEHFKAIKGSISMGCAVKKRLDQDITQILQDAETQMYLDKTLHRKNNDREQMLRIVETLHERDPREKKHAEWVSAICERIGRLLGLPEREIVLLQKAGYLHDIGKIVLLDDGTPGKEGEMQQHPVIGYRILNSFEDTMDLAECVLAHHERWDGSGYPKGLKGNEIPKLARIIALAECYATMVGRREDGSAAGEEKFFAEIRRQAGSRFDPEIVEVLLRKGNIFQEAAARTPGS